MAHETFEDQAEAIRRVLNGAKPNKIDRRHLECAARNLEAVGALRHRIVTLASSAATEEQTDGLAEEIAKTLHIPVPGS